MMWISTGAAFYGAMRRGAVVKTSMVNPDLMANYFERALSQGDDVLYVGMSGRHQRHGAGRGLSPRAS